MLTLERAPEGVTHPLQYLLQLPTFDAVLTLLRRLPNCDLVEQLARYGEPVTPNTVWSVTWRNWKKYQEETTWERMRRYRAQRVTATVTAKRRGEERSYKPPIVPLAGDGVPLVASGPVPPHRKALGAPDPAFARFWQAYPRKVARKRAEQAWGALGPAPALVSTLLVALGHHAEYWRRHGTPLDKIPHAGTWLSQRRWEDELAPPTATEDPYAQFPRG